MSLSRFARSPLRQRAPRSGVETESKRARPNDECDGWFSVTAEDAFTGLKPGQQTNGKLQENDVWRARRWRLPLDEQTGKR